MLGHEVGHVIARHANERVSQQLGVALGLAALRAAIREERNQAVILGALGLGAQYGILLPFSRTHEREADRIGQRLMAKAGLDPRAAVELWREMKAQSGGSVPEFLSTHPGHEGRIEALQDGLSRTVPVYERARQAGRRPACEAPEHGQHGSGLAGRSCQSVRQALVRYLLACTARGHRAEMRGETRRAHADATLQAPPSHTSDAPCPLYCIGCSRPR